MVVFKKTKVNKEGVILRGYLRPSSIDTNDSSVEQAIRAGVLDICDVPPDFFYAGQSRWSECYKSKY